MGFLYFIIVQYICILTPNGPLFRLSDDEILFLLLLLRKSDAKTMIAKFITIGRAWTHGRTSNLGT